MKKIMSTLDKVVEYYIKENFTQHNFMKKRDNNFINKIKIIILIVIIIAILINIM